MKYFMHFIVTKDKRMSKYENIHGKDFTYLCVAKENGMIRRKQTSFNSGNFVYSLM